MYVINVHLKLVGKNRFKIHQNGINVLYCVKSKTLITTHMYKVAKIHFCTTLSFLLTLAFKIHLLSLSNQRLKI